MNQPDRGDENSRKAVWQHVTAADPIDWAPIDAQFGTINGHRIEDLFTIPNRTEQMVMEISDLRVDFTRHLIQPSILAMFGEVFGGEITKWRKAMFAGVIINTSEQRAAAHVMLRDPVSASPLAKEARGVLDAMSEFTESVHEGTICGATGKPFRTIVNIGIGGSDLGPMLAYNALQPYVKSGIEVRFMSNLDPEHLEEVLKGLNPEETMLVVASKTFTTSETITNMILSKRWLEQNLPTGSDANTHIVAVTANQTEAASYGVQADRIFIFWDWVGGRFSLPSAVGLSVMLAIGVENFRQILAGMYAVDSHFLVADWERNIPFVMAVLDIWYQRYFNAHSRAVIPYAHALAKFPAYLQQLEMESNGKRVTRDGRVVSGQTAIPVWGEPGTNSQHAFFQFLHQGTEMVPIDLIGFAKSRATQVGHQALYLANLLGQLEALTFGSDQSKPSDPQKFYPGNRPSTLLLAPVLTPFVLGQLIAIYEHKVFVQGCIWGINSFDQWGVELGKSIAGEMMQQLLPLLYDHPAQLPGNVGNSESYESTLEWIQSHLG